MKILLYSGTETSILDLHVVHGLASRWQRSGNVFPPSISEFGTRIWFKIIVTCCSSQTMVDIAHQRGSSVYTHARTQASPPLFPFPPSSSFVSLRQASVPGRPMSSHTKCIATPLLVVVTAAAARATTTMVVELRMIQQTAAETLLLKNCRNKPTSF